MITMDRQTTAPVPTLPGRYYYDPAIFAQEQERIFSRCWVCVGSVRQIAAPGAYFLAALGGESIIVLRDRNSEVRAFYNVCLHRGAQLCSQECGQLHATIQCRYHAWTYGLDGRLVGAPNMKDEQGFDQSQYGLKPVHAQVWEGLIFLNLSEQPGSLADQTGSDHPRLARYGIGNLAVGDTSVYEVRANWKLLIANYEECAHCALVHPELSAKVPSFKAGLATGGLDDGATFADGVKTLTATGTSNRLPLPGLLTEDHYRYYGSELRPNVLLDLHPDYVVVSILLPQAANHTRVISETLFDPRAMAAPDFDGRDAIEFTDLVNRQDFEVCELCQRGVASRVFRDGGVYGTHERHIRQFDDYVLELLGETHQD